MLNSILWTPILFGLIALLGPRRFAPWIAGVGTVVTLVLAAIVAIGIDPSGGLQYVQKTPWIPDLGISYALGVDGISIFLVLLTALAWVPAVAFAASRRAGGDRERLFYFADDTDPRDRSERIQTFADHDRVAGTIGNIAKANATVGEENSISCGWRIANFVTAEESRIVASRNPDFMLFRGRVIMGGTHNVIVVVIAMLNVLTKIDDRFDGRV